jgi:hypothetical protein
MLLDQLDAGAIAVPHRAARRAFGFRPDVEEHLLAGDRVHQVGGEPAADPDSQIALLAEGSRLLRLGHGAGIVA